MPEEDRRSIPRVWLKQFVYIGRNWSGRYLVIRGEDEVVTIGAGLRTLPPAGAKIGPADPGVVKVIDTWRKGDFDPLEDRFDGLTFGIFFVGRGVEEVVVLKRLSIQDSEVAWVPACVNGTQASEVEEEGESLQPRHPDRVPFTGRVEVVGKVVEVALVHRHILAAMMAQPLAESGRV